MNIFQRIWQWNPAISEQGGMVESVGLPNASQAGSGANGEVLDLSPNYGSATQTLAFKQSDIPRLNDPDKVIKFIKKLRNQTRLNTKLMELADQVVQGFRIKGSEEVSNWFVRAQVYSAVHRIAYELFTLGWCVVYVNEDKKGLPTLQVLHNVTVKRGVDGTPHVWLQLDDTVKRAIQANSKLFPKYWQQQVTQTTGIDITRVYDGKGMKLKQGGAYFITIPTEPEDVYPVPPLYALASHLISSERLLINLDAMSEVMATVLTHITVGNAEGQDLRSGKPKQIEADRTKKLGEAFNQAKVKGTIITPGDVSIKTVAADKNPYTTNLDTAKAQGAIVREGIGISDFQNVHSEGAAAFLARQMFPTIDRVRHGIIQQGFLKVMLLDISDRVSGSEKARIIWSLDSIVPLSDKLNIGKFRWITGGMSIQQINEMFDPDYDLAVAMEEKQFERDNYMEVVPLLWEPSQGLSDAAAAVEASKPSPLTPQHGGAGPTAQDGVSPKSPGTAENPGAGRPKK
jgi:hypothetical protein